MQDVTQQDNIRLSERSLGREEAERLSTALKETPNILGYTPRELQNFHEVIVAHADGEDGGAAGVCILKPMPGRWTDIAVIFVFPEYRRRGIGSRLFTAAIQRIRDQKRHVLCVSRDASIIRLMERDGMRFISSMLLPWPVQYAYSIHYSSVYRFKEALRKAAIFRGQPPFRYAVLKHR